MWQLNDDEAQPDEELYKVDAYWNIYYFQL